MVFRRQAIGGRVLEAGSQGGTAVVQLQACSCQALPSRSTCCICLDMITNWMLALNKQQPVSLQV